MVFLCQKDSYLKELSTKVKACEKSNRSINPKNKNDKVEGFDIELEETILFPEGGGQPCDKGTIDNKHVKKVIRVGAKAIHFVEEDIDVGKEVKVLLDWTRRFDHMQQHSGQHLITAIADKLFDFKTTSWDLGKNVCFIELDTPTVSKHQLIELENEVNRKIIEQTKVTVHTYSNANEIPEGVRARGLPNDHVGEVRTVEFEDVDCNMCCGTHVDNLSHLQIIKLLQVEKGKKGKSNLYFLAGNRVSKYVEEKWSMDKNITKSLKCGPEGFLDSINRTMKQLKVAHKNETCLLREVALFEVEKIHREFKEQNKKFFHWHRKEGNNEYMNIIAKNVPCDVFLFLTVGDDKNAGLILLKGNEKFLQETEENVRRLLQAKTNTKSDLMQGKANSLKKTKELVCFLKSKLE